MDRKKVDLISKKFLSAFLTPGVQSPGEDGISKGSFLNLSQKAKFPNIQEDSREPKFPGNGQEKPSPGNARKKFNT